MGWDAQFLSAVLFLSFFNDHACMKKLQVKWEYWETKWKTLARPTKLVQNGIYYVYTRYQLAREMYPLLTSSHNYWGTIYHIWEAGQHSSYRSSSSKSYWYWNGEGSDPPVILMRVWVRDFPGLLLSHAKRNGVLSHQLLQP